MSASLTDILTTGKNLVTAINNLTHSYLSVQGTKISPGITTDTLVQAGSGRVAELIVLATDTVTDGAVHDAISVAAANAANKIWTIKAAVTSQDATSQPVVLNLPITNGIVVLPGTGMTAVISYS